MNTENGVEIGVGCVDDGMAAEDLGGKLCIGCEGSGGSGFLE